jgi:hypothetical protein
MHVSRGPYAHAGIAFHFSGSPHDDFFVDCRAVVNEESAQSGLSVKTPLDIYRTQAAHHAAHVETVLMPLDLSESEIADTIGLYHRFYPWVRYGGAQLFSNWIAARTPFYISRRQSCRFRWTCSEAVVRLMPVRIQTEIFHIGEFRFDEYLPSGPLPASVHRLATLAGIPSIPL